MNAIAVCRSCNFSTQLLALPNAGHSREETR